MYQPMNKDPKEILDDEIRIISSDGENVKPIAKTKPRFAWWKLLSAMVIVVLAIALIVSVRSKSIAEDEYMAEAQITEVQEQPIANEPSLTAVPYTSLIDTIVDKIRLTILKPQNAVARLVIGDSILEVCDPVLVVQAADVRRDNKQIVGAYVINGEMKSRGKAKSGFCAIINDEITIGIAQTTPLLEKATEENGYFFRQYPLVYEGEIIENKPKNLSQRKALAVLNDEIVVLLSHERLSFHDFSHALADLGVKNAIYLTGSTSYLKARLQDGRIYEFGKREAMGHPNTNYIYWQ